MSAVQKLVKAIAASLPVMDILVGRMDRFLIDYLLYGKQFLLHVERRNYNAPIVAGMCLKGKANLTSV